MAGRPTRSARVAATAAIVLSAVLLTACAAAGPATAPGVHLPDPSAGFDYQLGGPYDPPSGATTIARDRTAEPAGAGYDICYVNGFQTQPDASQRFAAEHPELLVQHGGGPLADLGWPDEYLFDTSTAAKRQALSELVGAWIVGCADAGYDAVEIDNLDSYTRSEGALRQDDNLALAAEYARIAHDAGLAIGQKNTADQSRRLRELGYDFAVTESCAEFDECGAYTAVYDAVLDIEYTDELGEAGFDDACASADRPPTMILRDHDLTTPGSADYAYRSCTD